MQEARFHEAPEMLSIPMIDVYFFRVGIDLVGLLPTRASRNRFVINAADYLTKWP